MPTEVHLVKAIVSPIVMYGCESWTIKRAEHQRTDAFELQCRRRLLRVPWTCYRSNKELVTEVFPDSTFQKEIWARLKAYSKLPPKCHENFQADHQKQEERKVTGGKQCPEGEAAVRQVHGCHHELLVQKSKSKAVVTSMAQLFPEMCCTTVSAFQLLSQINLAMP